ncbi:MAG: ABC transporter ATP-binding protein, partial [Gammaproteobacteria bacterium]|nr:ABC transporter ATP-binding protein [Gammaproteobacteria bacterium]
RQDAADKRRQLQPLRNKIKKLETKMEKLNTEKDGLSEQLASNALYEDENKSQLNDCLAQQGKVIQALQDIEEQWLAASEELENLT